VRIIEQILDGIDDAPLSEAHLFDRACLVKSRHAGVAYRFREERSMSGAPAAQGAMELARLALSSELDKASVGVAAINSLIELRGAIPCPGSGTSLLMEWGAGRDVALVGHFAFADELRKAARKLWVLELDPREGDLPADQAAEVIPKAEVVAITGTTFINHTLEGLLELAKGKKIMILGPSTIMSPILFDYGVEALCGCKIVDIDEVTDRLSSGEGLRRLGGVKRMVLKTTHFSIG